MGTEVNLFYAKIKRGIEFDILDEVLIDVGCSKKPSSDSVQNYEVTAKQGITELQVLQINKKIDYFSIRFSFGNPSSVIDQTINIFKRLVEKLPVEIFDSENMEPVKFRDEYLTELKRLLLFRKNFFDIHQAKMDVPMRGDKETFDYVREYKKKYEKEEGTSKYDISTKTALVVIENSKDRNIEISDVLNKIGKNTVKKYDWAVFDICSLNSLKKIGKLREAESDIKNTKLLSGMHLLDLMVGVKTDWGVFLAFKKNTRPAFNLRELPPYFDRYSLQRNSAEIEIRSYGNRIFVFAKDKKILETLATNLKEFVTEYKEK